MSKSKHDNDKTVPQVNSLAELLFKVESQLAPPMTDDPEVEKDLNEIGCVYFTGPPGVGKTAILGQMCKRNDWGFVTINGSQFDQGELKGLPVVGDNVTRYLKPEFLKRLEDLSKEHESVICYIDEAAKIPWHVEGDFYGLVNERVVHPHDPLPGNVKFVLTSNRVEHGSMSDNELNPVILNRGGYFEYNGPSIDEFIDYAQSSNVHPSVISFLRENPKTLLDFNPDRRLNATHRSWTNAGKSLSKLSLRYGEGNVKAEFTRLVIEDYLPASIVKEFLAHAAFEKVVPKIKEVCQNPDTAMVPDNISAMYYMGDKLAHLFNKDNAKAVEKYMSRFDNSDVRTAYNKAVTNMGKGDIVKNLVGAMSGDEKTKHGAQVMDDVMASVTRSARR